jgi:hypothetical protein
MRRICDECQAWYDDAECLTICPHAPLAPPLNPRVVELIGQAVIEDRPLSPAELDEVNALCGPASNEQMCAEAYQESRRT